MDKLLANHLTTSDNKRQQQNENQILDKFSNVFIEYQLMREFVLYRNQNISHIYTVPSDSSPYLWFGVMFVHKGLYRGLILRFSVVIGSSYPDCEIPKLMFDSIPFHPLINPITGELNTSLAFNDWKSSDNKIWQIIDYGKQVFESIDLNQYLTNDSLLSSHEFNTKAIDLYKQDFKEFVSKVNQTISECNEKINDLNTNDSNAIVFGHFNEDIHQELKNKLLSGVNVLEEMQLSDPTHPSVTGLSWVGPGSHPWVQNDSNQMFPKSGA